MYMWIEARTRTRTRPTTNCAHKARVRPPHDHDQSVSQCSNIMSPAPHCVVVMVVVVEAPAIDDDLRSGRSGVFVTSVIRMRKS